MMHSCRWHTRASTSPGTATATNTKIDHLDTSMGGSVSPHLLYLLPCVFKLDHISHLSSFTNQYYTSKSFPTCPSLPSKGTFHQTLELTLHNQPAPLYPSLLRSSPHLAFTSTESLSPKLPCLQFLPIPVQSGCSSSQHTSLKLFLQIVCTFSPP